MTKTERKERIERLENRLFLIRMVDRWTNEDRRIMNEIEKELRELKKVAQRKRGKDNENFYQHE